jgi:hypothetical protein
MRFDRLLLLAVAGSFTVPSSFAQFADAVVDYVPGAGVTSSYTNPAAALGQPSRSTPGNFGGPVDPFSPAWQGTQLVELGAGGTLTLRFKSPIQPDRSHAFGCDFVVFGSTGFTITNGDYTGDGVTDGSLFGNFTGQSRVSVSADGTNFFVLNPALAPTLDSLFPTDGTGDFFRPVNPALVGGSFAGLGLPGIRALYAGSAGGAGFSLGWAQDGAGHPVILGPVQFVRLDVLSGRAEIDGLAIVAPVGGGAVWWEDFATDPHLRGWTGFGDPNLFRWNAANQNLEVTWDSSRSNSYFQLPLGTLLSRRDDFSVALDLTLNDIAIGVEPSQPGTFQIAFGFLNQSDARKTGFIRGTGSDSPNLVEFNFFPDSGFGPTVWPVATATNSAVNYNGSTDFGLFDLPVGVPMRFVLSYTATTQTVAVSVTTNGVLVGPVISAPLMTNFTEFVVDTFALTSYSGVGQAPFMPGSILAHGIVDNLIVSAPPPPVQEFRGRLVSGNWEASFGTRTNWSYRLESSGDLVTWKSVGELIPGNGQRVTVLDTNAASFGKQLYRVNAQPFFLVP